MDFGSYVRHARERQSLTIDQVAAATKLNRQLLLDLEANDIKRWPKQDVYRRGFVRSYARAIKLDPEDALDRFNREFEIDERVVPAVPPLPPPSVAKPLLEQVRNGIADWKRFTTPAALGLGLLFGLIALTLQNDPSSAAAAVSRQVAPVVNAAAGPTNGSTGPDAASAVVSHSPEIKEMKEVKVEDINEPAPPTNVEGTLIVTSDPPTATVTVNGIGRGQTPARIKYLPLGSY